MQGTFCPPSDYMHLGGDASDGPPPAKRPRYFEADKERSSSTDCAYAALDSLTAVDDEEDMEDATDPESYYTSVSADSLAQEVKTFISTTFRRSIPKRKRLDMAKEYPKPDMPATKVPKLDPDIKGALDRDFADRRDEQMAKIQASVLASCAPLANFWSHMSKQGFSGNDQELIPASEVVKVTKDTLALIGNASNYIAQSRRKAFVDSISKSKPKLAKFLREICKEDLGDTGSELFGPQARKKITERANTIEAFNKALVTVEAPTSSYSAAQGRSPTNSRFLSKRPVVTYGSGLGRAYIPYNRDYTHHANRGRFFQSRSQQDQRKFWRRPAPKKQGQGHQQNQ